MKKSKRIVVVVMLFSLLAATFSPSLTLATESFAPPGTEQQGSRNELKTSITEFDSSDDSTIITEPTQPVEPEELVKPSEPAESVEPSKPSQPVNPTEPEIPEVPTQPIEPTQPTEPTQPKEPIQPEVPIETPQPVTPTQPSQPVNPTPKDPTVTNPALKVSQSVIPSKQTQDKIISQPQLIDDELADYLRSEMGQLLISELGEDARKIAQENNLYASVMIAQALLESASGTSSLSRAPYYNLFGIKGSKEGRSVSFSTLEQTSSGESYSIQASFRAYRSYAESLEDYVKLIKDGLTTNQSIYAGVWKENAVDYREATKALTGVYATDINYDKKLNQLIETYNLTEFDLEVASYQEHKLQVPLNNYQVTSEFGVRRNVLNKTISNHYGIDLAAVTGTNIKAVKEGQVVATGFDPSAGNYVILKHAEDLFTSYFHLNTIRTYRGETIRSGQSLGTVGSTGDSTGPHLHFAISREMWSNYLNPRHFITFE